MKITPPADDYGLQRLKQADSHREVKETAKVSATPRIESSDEHHEPGEPLLAERIQQERRRRKRRQVKLRTTLDTRTNHERRQQESRQGEVSDSDSGPHGIDDFA